MNLRLLTISRAIINAAAVSLKEPMPWHAPDVNEGPDESDRKKADIYLCDDDKVEQMEMHNEVKQQHACSPAAKIRQATLVYKTQQQPGVGFPVRNCSPNVMKFKEGLHKVIPAASYSMYAAIHA